jgi:hypothetical protein
MNMWRFNTRSGMWDHVRSVTAETAAAWLAVWQRDEPGTLFVIAKSKPRKAPKWDKEECRYVLT